MSKLFLSHASQDDSFVRDLRAALADHGQAGWIDSRELRGGDPLWSAIQEAIEAASAFAVLISPDAFQSDWVTDELEHAIKLRQKRGKAAYPVIPLLLDGARLGAFKKHFGEEPLHIPVRSGAGGVEAAIHPLLVALGLRLPSDLPPTPQPLAEPVEELLLELSHLRFQEQDGVRRATARARLVYEPAKKGQPSVHSAQHWRLTAPIGPIEAGELKWYLEKYAIWPSQHFRPRAQKVEENLIAWGQLLYKAAMPPGLRENVMNAWAKIDGHAGRRFSVQVDAAPEFGAPEAEVLAAQEAATTLLGLPWELLHDGKSYLFQGAKPTRVRRRLPSTESHGVPVVAPPIRILLVTARPEDESCAYIDHRVSALPLVEAMEKLPGLVQIHVLSPPTLPALREELDRARAARQPYHVVHFDGHGVYDRQAGLGGLCFESPEDADKLVQRRHLTVFTDELGPLLRDHRIPLVFLEACQTAQAEKASESVASELLKVGVASVVAMSHSVLVETARRFVAAFYRALAAGQRVGQAMLAGQRELKDDPSRGRIFGAGELRLEDWFVPVLFQEKDDPQLFTSTPAPQTVADFRKALAVRLGELPPEPETGFVGRSRDLLALQRLLGRERYAVLRGQGGEGKTALAAEFARWMVRSQQRKRAAFVSVEIHSHAAAVLDSLGRQLVGPGYSVATFDGLEKAILPVERALAEQATLLVLDNMESILLPPYLETPEALSEEARRELEAILTLAARLQAQGETRLLFTSREALPEPFDGSRQRRELHQLEREDAVKLVERALQTGDGDAGESTDARREEIEELLGAVHGHARTLALLAPALRERGVTATRESLVELMAEMERTFPGSREKSLFASVELSLRRMSPENRERARVLGVFHGGVNLNVLGIMKGWDDECVTSLGLDLIQAGLATPNRYKHLNLDPALCPYLRERLDEAERATLTARWVEAMRAYVEVLRLQKSQNAELSAILTEHDLPNLFAVLDLMQGTGNADGTIELATSLYSLLENAGKPRLLERLGQVRDAAAATMGGTWNHASFLASFTRIEQQLASGQYPSALEGAQHLLLRARTAGEQAYREANYDLAVAHVTLARVLKMSGGAEQALPLLEESRTHFEAVAKILPGRGAEVMASVCISEQGDCFRLLGRLDEAVGVYEEGIHRAEQLGDVRSVVGGKSQLGTIRMQQRRYPEALKAYAEMRERFTDLKEPGCIAGSWHQTGIVYQEMGQPDAAEDAYRQSLEISVLSKDIAGQARTLGQLGNLYDDVHGLPEEAVTFHQEAADKYAEGGDARNEGLARSNLAATLRKLRRLDEARQEIRRATECKAPFGHASEPWKTWAILAEIEMDAGKPAAAAEAKAKAIASYLAYRRDGGENHSGSGRLALAMTQALLDKDRDEATSLLLQAAPSHVAAGFGSYINALQAIVAGSRDRRLAEAPELDYTMAAEILILLETLEKPR